MENLVLQATPSNSSRIEVVPASGSGPSALPLVTGPSRRRALITTGLMLGMLIAAMESTVISTAMPTVIGALHGIELYPWVFSAYLLTSTTTVPIYGKLADLFGRRHIFLVAAGVFLVGSMLSGAAHSMWQLIAFRALQGLGAGGVLPLTLTLIGDLYTMKERPRVQSLFTSMWGLASLSGPLLGAIITEQLSWRWVFYVNLPFALASMALVGCFLREPKGSGQSGDRLQIDYAGLLLLTSGVVALLGLLLQLGQGRALTSPSVVGLLSLTLVLILAFIRQERRAPEPLLPLDLFANPIIAASTVGNILIGTMMYAVDSYMPLFMQGVRGGTAHSAGLVLTPLVLLWSLSAYAGARALARFGFARTAVFGVSCILLSAACLAGISAATPAWMIVAIMALLGGGMGPSSIAFLVSAQNAVSWQHRGVVTAASQFFRMISGTIGVGVLGAVLNARLIAAMNLRATPGFTPNALLNAAARARFSPHALREAESALAQGLHLVFLLLAVLAFVSFVRVLQLVRLSVLLPASAQPAPSAAHELETNSLSTALSLE